MHHEKYPKFFDIHMKLKKRELISQIHKLKISLFLTCLWSCWSYEFALGNMLKFIRETKWFVNHIEVI